MAILLPMIQDTFQAWLPQVICLLPLVDQKGSQKRLFMKSSISANLCSGTIFKSALCVLFLLACGGKPVEWTPIFLLKEVKVFSRIDGTQHQVLFSALPGEICELGENVEGKVFLNTRIRCSRGEGWA